MLGNLQLTCEELLPILRGDTFAGVDQAWLVLMDERNVQRITLKTVQYWRKGRGAQPSIVEPDEHLFCVITGLVARIKDHHGLSRPTDCEHRSPKAWWVTTVRNMASDVYRQRAGFATWWRCLTCNTVRFRKAGKPKCCTNSKCGAETIESLPANYIPPDLEVVSADTPEDVSLLQQKLDDYRRMAKRILMAHTPAPRKLAFVCLYEPRHLSRELVEAACGQVYQKGAGLTRTPEETWTLLETWREAHGSKPGSSASRLEIAWIFRAPPAVGLKEWQDTRPKEVRRARDLVRQWANRARRAVKDTPDTPDEEA